MEKVESNVDGPFNTTSTLKNYRNGRAHSTSAVKASPTKTGGAVSVLSRVDSPLSSSQPSVAYNDCNGGEKVCEKFDSATKLLHLQNLSTQNSIKSIDDHDMRILLRPCELQKFLAWTLIMCRRVREQPAFTTQAQVFQLDRKTQRHWTESSSKTVPVHFYHDIVRRTYRVICVDGSKPLINCTLSASVVVTRTSSKFAQWLDPHTKVVYGLGFRTENEMEMFIAKFKQFQSEVRQVHVDETQHDHGDIPLIQYDSSTCPAMNSSGIEGDPDDPVQLLRFEAERLKLAIADSCRNAQLWAKELREVQMQNEALKAALDSLTSSFKNDGSQTATDSGLCPSTSNEIDNTACAETSCISESSTLTSSASQSVSVEQWSKMPIDTSPIATQLQNIVEENKALRQKISSNEPLAPSSGEKRQQILYLQQQIGEKLTEALRLHRELTKLLQ